MDIATKLLYDAPYFLLTLCRWCKNSRLMQEIRLDKTENIELTIKKSNDSRANYQEWWWQTISKNALYKYTHRTEVHPGTEYLHRNNYNWSNKILFAVSIQVAGFYIGSPSLSQPFRGFAHQNRQEKKRQNRHFGPSTLLQRIKVVILPFFRKSWQLRFLVLVWAAKDRRFILFYAPLEESFEYMKY